MSHEAVNSTHVVRNTFDTIGSRFTEKTSLVEAKTILLEYSMLTAANYILSGVEREDLDQKTQFFSASKGWLEAIKKANENNWTDLLKLVEIDTMVVEDGHIDGSQESVQAVYKMTDMIAKSQGIQK